MDRPIANYFGRVGVVNIGAHAPQARQGRENAPRGGEEPHPVPPRPPEPPIGAAINERNDEDAMEIDDGHGARAQEVVNGEVPPSAPPENLAQPPPRTSLFSRRI